MRSLLFLVLAGASLIVPPASAEEPLFLRIRPSDDDAAVAARARALREAVWARSDRRARIAIASVCTGCLKPLPSAPPGDRDGATAGPIADPPSAPPTAGDP